MGLQRPPLASTDPAREHASWLSALSRLIVQEHHCAPPHDAIAWTPVSAFIGPATYTCPECRRHWYPRAFCDASSAMPISA